MLRYHILDELAIVLTKSEIFYVILKEDFLLLFIKGSIVYIIYKRLQIFYDIINIIIIEINRFDNCCIFLDMNHNSYISVLYSAGD